jgi:hypothetical protein
MTGLGRIERTCPTLAARLRYKYNRQTLLQLLDRFQPDAVMHADGSYLFRVEDGHHLNVWDLQDAADLAMYGPKHQFFCRRVLQEDLSKVGIAYAVSKQAAEGLKRQASLESTILPLTNGADFQEIRSITSERIAALRKQHDIVDKFVVTYIGGDVWFDEAFVTRLMTRLHSSHPDVHLLVVGNVRPVCLPNVTHVGTVPPNIAAEYYQLSDLGMLLKDSRHDSFLYHSVPLKIVQYAAARKPVMTFPVAWCEEKRFANVFAQPDDDIGQWSDTLQRIRQRFVWNDDLEGRWAQFDWQVVARRVYSDMCAARTMRSMPP